MRKIKTRRRLVGVRSLCYNSAHYAASASGTRTAAITGSYVALALALAKMVKDKRAAPNALKTAVAAVSVGIVNGQELLDLNYAEDSRAEVDFNIVMPREYKFVEVQGTAEGEPFARDAMDRLIALGRGGIQELIKLQKQVINQ